jgi:hypothetical protein
MEATTTGACIALAPSLSRSCRAGLHIVPEKHQRAHCQRRSPSPLSPPPPPLLTDHSVIAFLLSSMPRRQGRCFDIWKRRTWLSTWAMSAHLLRTKRRRQQQMLHWCPSAQCSRCRRFLGTIAGAAGDSTATAHALNDNDEAGRGKRQRDGRLCANKLRQSALLFQRRWRRADATASSTDAGDIDGKWDACAFVGAA